MIRNAVQKWLAEYSNGKISLAAFYVGPPGSREQLDIRGRLTGNRDVNWYTSQSGGPSFRGILYYSNQQDRNKVFHIGNVLGVHGTSKEIAEYLDIKSEQLDMTRVALVGEYEPEDPLIQIVRAMINTGDRGMGTKKVDFVVKARPRAKQHPIGWLATLR